MRPWRDEAMWRDVAAELHDCRGMGLGRLLTEDAVRFSIARALVAAGVEPRELRTDRPHPKMPGTRIDLTVGDPSPHALFELSYPREPSSVNAPRTMILGHVLSDFVRLATYPGELDRVFVYVETASLRRYVHGVVDRHGINLHANTVTLARETFAALPATALNSLDLAVPEHDIRARRIVHLPVDGDLELVIYHVEPLEPGPLALGSHETVAPPGDAVQIEQPRLPSIGQPAQRTTARREILDAINAVLTRSGANTFTPAEIVAELNRRGTSYAESTIRTMITGHLCRNAPDNAATTYDDLERTDRGRYRLARSGSSGSVSSPTYRMT